MNKTKKMLALVLSIFTVLTLFTGCNKGKDTASSAPPQTAAPTEENVKVGTIVNLRNSKCLVYVTGEDYSYLPITERTEDEEKNKEIAKEFSYVGMPYPKGLTTPEKFIAFNLEDIERVVLTVTEAKSGAYDLTTDFEDTPEAFGGTIINLNPDASEIEDITRKAATYSAASNIKSPSGIEINVANVTYSADDDNGQDFLIFNVNVKNGTKESYPVNGKLDFQLYNKDDETVYESDETLVNGQNLLNFNLAPGEMKHGLIAYAVDQGSEENLILKYKTSKVPEIDFYVIKNPFPVLKSPSIEEAEKEKSKKDKEKSASESSESSSSSSTSSVTSSQSSNSSSEKK